MPTPKAREGTKTGRSARENNFLATSPPVAAVSLVREAPRRVAYRPANSGRLLGRVGGGRLWTGWVALDPIPDPVVRFFSSPYHLVQHSSFSILLPWAVG